MSDHENKPKIRMNKHYKIQVRKRKLFEELNNGKLVYKENGICDAYIKFGKPSLEEVISDVQKKENERAKRLNILVKALNKKNPPLVYDERVETYVNYVNKGGNLKETIEKGKIEWFYWNKTDFPNLIKIYNEERAENMALAKYIEKNGRDEYTEMIREGQMSICLY